MAMSKPTCVSNAKIRDSNWMDFILIEILEFLVTR
jgi:hypothetical protein